MSGPGHREREPWEWWKQKHSRSTGLSPIDAQTPTTNTGPAWDPMAGSCEEKPGFGTGASQNHSQRGPGSPGCHSTWEKTHSCWVMAQRTASFTGKSQLLIVRINAL